MSTELAVRPTSLLLDMETFNHMREQCSYVVKSGFLPKGVDTPEKALAIALKGHELGLTLMASFGGISIVQGKAVLEGQLMLALIYSMGGEVQFLERTKTKHRLRARRRPTDDWSIEFSWTIDDAKNAKLTGKDNWIGYPDDMLQWRCVAKMARAVFSDRLAGCYVEDEIDTLDVEHKVITRTERAQELLSAQDTASTKEEDPQNDQPDKPVEGVGEPVQKADPMVVAKLISEFHKLGIPTEEVYAMVLVKTADQITVKDVETLRASYAKEREKGKKKEEKK